MVANSSNGSNGKGTFQKDPCCWEIKNCMPAERSRCPAYKASKNCWEVRGTALDRGDTVMCETCPVILSRIARAIAQAMSGSQPLVER